MIPSLRFSLAAAVFFVLSACSCPKSEISGIYDEFRSAPDSTRTKVWWFHGETFTSHEGITADLEAFKEAGVGGVVYYDQVHGDAEGAFTVFSDEWWDALIFSAQEADRLGLSFEINLSNGFVAGGPWIDKANGMTRLCSSEVIVAGGDAFNGRLPRPANGEFWDVATLAFPIPAEVDWSEHVLISSTKKFSSATILEYDFGSPFTARSLSYSEVSSVKAPTNCMNVPGGPSDIFYGDGFIELPCIGQLEASDDGVNWRKVADMPTLYRIHDKLKTISFPAETARWFRLNLHDWNRPDGKAARTLEIRSASLSGAAKTYEWENRAGVVSAYNGESLTPGYSASEVIDISRIVNLTALTGNDGSLQWTAPDDAASWVILRVAQTCTGGHTKHGRPGQMGLECDKLNASSAKLQWDNFAQVIIDSLDACGLKPRGVVMDSHEMGSQNWTFGYENEFSELHGYDITPWLPALLGYVVGSPEESESVLFDHRRTIAHLVNHRYFAALDTLAMQAGVMFTAQAMGNGQSMTCDNIAAKGAVRRPQGEFWAKHTDGCYDIKEAASAAHVYGLPIASEEAYTDANYGQTLAYLKNLADYAYSYQLNEFVVCASAYQPWLDRVPGNTATFRQYCLNRNNTMWPLSRGFWDYQSRCAYMMRQGEPVVDLCIYLGSEVSTKLLSHRVPEIPEGYDWDVCTDDAFLRLMEASRSRLVAESGMSYSVLVVERLARLTPEAEDKVVELKRKGVPVYDARTEGDYGLPEFLSAAGIAPDAAFTSGNVPTDRVMFAHRRLNDAEIYFFSNHSDSRFSQEVVLRGCGGRTAEFWDSCTGERLSLESSSTPDGGLSVALCLAPRESGFVVVHSSSVLGVPALKRTYGADESVFSLRDDWQVDFLLPRGSERVAMPELCDWTSLSGEDLKHHSGMAVYRKSFVSPSVPEGGRCYLRIDGLEACARVSVNGQVAGYIWCSPWELDIADYLSESDNLLEIEVVNQLINRMIGDIYLPESQRTTWATTPIVKAGDKLLPAGITSDVVLVVR